MRYILSNLHVIPNFHDWRVISFAVAKEVGVKDAKVLMIEYFPEFTRGEYENLFKGYDPSKSPGIGSIYKIESNWTPPNSHALKVVRAIGKKRERVVINE
jgi:hypothetical protein